MVAVVTDIEEAMMHMKTAEEPVRSSFFLFFHHRLRAKYLQSRVLEGKLSLYKMFLSCGGLPFQFG